MESYLGERGMDRPVKRYKEYKNLWFIIFKDYPNDVEVSTKSWCYECFDEIPIKEMKWNKSFFEKIKKRIDNFYKKNL